MFNNKFIIILKHNANHNLFLMLNINILKQSAHHTLCSIQSNSKYIQTECTPCVIEWTGWSECIDFKATRFQFIKEEGQGPGVSCVPEEWLLNEEQREY